MDRSSKEFRCERCDTVISSFHKWIDHLISRAHQRRAQRSVWKWDYQMKDRALFVHCGCLCDCPPFLKFFCSDTRTITEFVRSPETLFMCIIQFETRDQVLEIMTDNRRYIFLVNETFGPLHIRTATSLTPLYLSTKWPNPSPVKESSVLKPIVMNTVLSKLKTCAQPKASRVGVKRGDSSPSRLEKKRTLPIVADTVKTKLDTPVNQKENYEDEPKPSKAEKQKTARAPEPFKKKRRVKDSKIPIPPPPTPIQAPAQEETLTMIETGDDVTVQIRNEVEVPTPISSQPQTIMVEKDDDKLRFAIKEEEKPMPILEPINKPRMSGFLWGGLTELLAEVEIESSEVNLINSIMEEIKKAFTPTLPSVKLSLFRHKYIGLKNSGSNHLLIFLESGDSHSSRLWSAHALEKILVGPNTSISRLANVRAVEEGVAFHHQPSGTPFGLATHPLCLQEVVSCQLIEYLLTFDPRAKYLLSAIHYWARLNRITLAEDNISRIQQHETIPDPSALEWLCVFFLGWKKLIPTPRSILIRSAQPINKTFTRDEVFVERWRRRHSTSYLEEGTDHFVLSLLALAQDFFDFCAYRVDWGSLLNTMDAEIIGKNVIRLDFEHKCTKLNKQEIDLIRKLKLDEGERKDGIYLMQPLCPSFCFSISKEKFECQLAPAAMLSEARIGIFLDDLKTNGTRVWDSVVDVKILFDIRHPD